MRILLLLSAFAFGLFHLHAQDYRIHFIQNGMEIPLVDDRIILEKSTFQIQVELLKVDGVYGSCSFNDSLFKIPLNQSLPETNLIQWKIAVEPENNADKDILVSPESYFYWFYNPKVDTWHRFDPNPIVAKGRIIGTKTVTQLFLSEQDNTKTQDLSLAAVQKPLYFIFFLMDKKSENTFNRQRIQVNWK